MKYARFASLQSLAAGTIMALPLSIAAIGFANATAVVIPDATFSAGADTCTTTPCTTVDSQAFSTGFVDVNGNFNNGSESFVPGGTTTFNVSTDSHNSLSNAVETTGNNPAIISVGGGGNTMSVTVSGTPSPSIATVAQAPAGVGDASGSLRYSFVVLAPAGFTGTSVGITVDAKGSVSATAQASSGFAVNASTQLLIDLGTVNDLAQLSFGTSNGVSFNDPVTSGTGFVSALSGGSESGGFDESGTYQVILGEVHNVFLNTNLQCNDSAGVSCSASVDPTITAPAGFEVLFSQGFGDSAAVSVPEPSTAAMLLIGLMGVGFAARRRRAPDQLFDRS